MQQKKENAKYAKIRIDKDLWANLKAQCMIAGVKVWDVVQKGCELMLCRLEASNRAHKPVEITKVTDDSPATVQPVDVKGKITSE